MDDGVIEQTLWLCREVFVYRIPPRPGAGGWRSGEWRVGDKIFTGRCRVVAIGDKCEVRIEDTTSNEIFAVCPVPLGKKGVAVEPVSDSSRYFVLRVEDPVSKRHAFLGLGFAERGDAFDFNVALADHDKHVQIAHASASVSTSGPPAASLPNSEEVNQAVASLYKHHGDLSLKEGQTIRINVKKPVHRTSASGSSGGSPVTLTALPPPPGASAPRAFPSFPAPPSVNAAWGNSSSPAFKSGGNSTAFKAAATQQASPPVAPAPTLQAKVTSNWAVFE